VEGGYAVAVSSRAARHAAGAVVEGRVLRVGGRGEREQQKRDGDAVYGAGSEDAHSWSMSHACIGDSPFATNLGLEAP